MGYLSCVTGEVMPGPAGLSALLDYLATHGYVVGELGELECWDLGGTGLRVAKNSLVGTEEPQKTYGFDDALIETLQGAASEALIKSACLAREGQDNDDVEYYTYNTQDGWMTAITLSYIVPLDQRGEIRVLIDEAARKIIGEAG